MARWCLSPVIGNGTSEIVVGEEQTSGPYRLKVADVVQSHAAIIPGNEDGTPTFTWGIAKIDEASAAAADAVPGVTVFPDLQMDDVLTLAQRDWLIARVEALGLPTGWITSGVTVRHVLRTIGRYLENNFDIDWVNITE